jgi:hydrogenase expression/formation protein HypD
VFPLAKDSVKFMDDYPNGKNSERVLEDIRRIISRQWTLMCICGGQTHVVVKHDIDLAFPDQLNLVHGPGCAVCVTPLETVDKALAITKTPGTILCTPGEMLRAPGSASNLMEARSAGADVRVVYSPLDAVSIACKHPESEVVFLAAGFENGAAPTALAVYRAHEVKLRNFSLLGGYLRLTPALELLLSAEGNRVNGIVGAGHAATLAGYSEYEPLARSHETPVVLAGLDPLDILEASFRCVKQLEEGRAEVESTQSCSIPRRGDPATQFLVESVFSQTSCRWRGFGEVPQGALRLRSRFAGFDAETRFGLAGLIAEEPAGCMAGAVLRGEILPSQCPCFDHACTPEHPVGPGMVSSRGTCAADYRYRRPE